MKLTKTQKFKMERVARTTIQGAPYNPRKITPSARKKLQANLKKVGLLGPVTVNRTTGMRLVGGHQRLACIDAIEGTTDYTLDVAVVELTEKQEREQNIFMNNTESQGEWDLDILASILPDLDLDMTGFETISLDVMFDGTEHASLFASAKGEAEKESLSELQTTCTTKDAGDDNVSVDGMKRKASADAVAEMRKESKGKADAEDTERFAVVIFNSRADRREFNKRIGADPESRYIDYRMLEDKIK